MIDKMLLRGAKVHNLKNIDVDIPLGKIMGIAGWSGSGESSLAPGVMVPIDRLPRGKRCVAYGFGRAYGVERKLVRNSRRNQGTPPYGRVSILHTRELALSAQGPMPSSARCRHLRK